ncbi:tetratricopeptide repeat protein [Streptomyces griseoluteus]|uniref:tetratricopeptide repeat protein n=1 Tax=Streptomyces griseoluteus TaxID=29306 RepID=UPI001E347961|nr:tetratricopeptide repeat protein [Streptomyces griseoluteus]
MSVGAGGVGAGGSIEGSALGENSQVANIHFHQAPATAVAWPVEIGPVPARASAFQPRRELRERVEGARADGGTVVLTQVLSGGGGVGKTQLAAACACDAVAEGYDLVVWAAATEAQQVITQYAQAAARVGVAGCDPEADARLFLEWLATTSHRWLVVLDDVTDPAVLTSWWPASRTGSGWVLATTRLKDARMTGGGRTRIDIDVYTPDEARTFVEARLTGEGMEHLLDEQVAELASALGHLPLALSHATAYMINEELTCTAYLALFTDQRTSLEEALPESADTEGYGRQITTTLLLSLEAAQAADTTGFATTALRLVALLDPSGHPHALWSAPPLLDCLAPDEASPAQAHKTLRLLHRYALITCDTRAEPRAVRIHALTARAVREAIPEARLPELATAAADALVNIWPYPDQLRPDLAATLRANTDALVDHAYDCLWGSGCHPVLRYTGDSLRKAGLVAPALTYWQRMAADCERLLGHEHLDTLVARNALASCHAEAGRIEEAVGRLERVADDCERLLGAEHPDALAVRNNLATAYGKAGRIAEAIGLHRRLVADCEQQFGDMHPHTLTVRNNLAAAYRDIGHLAAAIGLQERVVADSERLLVDGHPDTLDARGNLADCYLRAGYVKEATRQLEWLIADIGRLLGDGHPGTLSVRDNLARCYWLEGREDEAIRLLERVVADGERLLGERHPATSAFGYNLAVAYWKGGRQKEAVRLSRALGVDLDRMLGRRPQ